MSDGKTANSTPQRSNPALLLAMTALDTTWRTLVPGIAGISLGLWADHAWHTTPFVMIAGLLLGMGLSAFLIFRQFKAIKP